MIDDLAGLAVAAATDVALAQAAKKRRWVRFVQAGIGLVFIVLVGGLIYITFRYS